MLEFLKDIFSVRKTHDELAMQFAERTAELSRANELLRQEVNERKRVEETIKNHLAQLSRKNRYETIISTVTRSVHQSINLQEVLENAAEAMYKNIEGVDYIAIYLVEGEEAVLRAHKNFPDWYIERAGRIPFPKGLVWKTILEKEPIYCGDVDMDTSIAPAGREVGIKSYLSVPVRFEGKTVGITGISSSRKNAFDEEELKLLDIVAQQIEVAINNAKQTEMIKENEERYRIVTETATDAIITIDEESRILFVNRAAERMFGYNSQDMLGQKLTMLMPEQLSHIHLASIKRYIHTGKKNIKWDGIELAGLHKSGKEIQLEVSFGEFIKDRKHIFTGIIRDITERKRVEEEILRLNAELERRVMERTAKLEATNRELQKEIIIRKKAEEALTNSLTRLAKKNRYETIVGAVTRSVHQSINLQSVLDHAVDAIKRNVDGAGLVGIYLVEGEEAVMKVHRGFTDQFIERAGRIPYPKGFTWKTIIEDKPLYCPDVNEDTAIGPAGRDEGIKSYLSMPIHYEGNALGSIHINSFEENAFDENELILLGIIVRQIEVAINNARQAEELRKAHYGLEIRVHERTAELLKTNEKLTKEIIERTRAEERLRETAERLQALSQRIAEVQEAERRRLVEVLHDHIGQNLTALSINLNIIGTILSPESAEKVEPRLKDCLKLVEQTTVRTRDIMVELYPPVLNDYGLLSTLRWFGEETTARTGLEVMIEGEEPTPRLPLEMEIALFRIVQEAVNNILKHASARRIGIELEGDSALVRLTVSDDGVGFDPVSIVADRARQSWGLLIMHGRADAMGGHLRVNSHRGRGTDVIVEVGR